MSWFLAGLVVLVLIGFLLSWTATRVDRLHNRLEGARSALEAQLYRRSGEALEVATSGLLDPATSLVLAEAAREARSAPDASRESAESNLTKALTAVFPVPEVRQELAQRPGADELLAELWGACRRVELARRFHNDTVATTRALRSRRLVRWFRLAGHASMPETIELDDTPPPGLSP
jgi:hypothetical protein